MSRFIALSVSCCLALFVATLCRAQSPSLSLPSLDPHTGAIDIDQLRQDVLSGLPFAAGLPDDLQVDSQFQRRSLGVNCIRVPDALRPAHRSLLASGLLVLGVMPGSPADDAGIRSGMVIVRVNKQLMRRPSDLPEVGEALEIVVLTVGGLRTATVESTRDQPTLPSLGGVQESVSVSNNNGRIQIDAVLATSLGPKRIRLEGTRTEVDAQISELSPALARKIRNRVGY